MAVSINGESRAIILTNQILPASAPWPSAPAMSSESIMLRKNCEIV